MLIALLFEIRDLISLSLALLRANPNIPRQEGDEFDPPPVYLREPLR